MMNDNKHDPPLEMLS